MTLKECVEVAYFYLSFSAEGCPTNVALESMLFPKLSNTFNNFQFVCIDSGGTIGPINISEELSNAVYSQSLISTNAAECMKQHLNDCVEFISDLHTINKVKVQTSCLTTKFLFDVPNSSCRSQAVVWLNILSYFSEQFERRKPEFK